MKIQKWPLKKIVPYGNNPRDIRQAIEGVKESIRRFGFLVPIVVDTSRVIITGHTRYQALLELGWTHALVIQSDMSEERANEYRIVDNRSSEIALWDKDRLKAELRSIRTDMQLFFDPAELKDMMADLVQAEPVDKELIEKTQAELNGHFETLATNLATKTTFVDCQHCGKRFGFDNSTQGFGKEYNDAKAKAQ